jgi:hypothetical protein
MHALKGITFATLALGKPELQTLMSAILMTMETTPFPSKTSGFVTTILV